MADGSQPTESKMPPLADKALLIFNAQGTMTSDQFDELALCVGKALALSDVLNIAANGDGDVESLHKDTLAMYSSMLHQVLRDARALIDGTTDIASKEVSAACVEVSAAHN